MSNHNKLKQLLLEIFLLDAEEFHFGLNRSDIDTWDSLGVVSLAAGIEEVFGCHLAPDEAASIQSIEQLIATLGAKGIAFGE